MSENNDQRLTGLEEAFTHHEGTILELSDQITEQWKLIERLNRRIAELEEKLENQAFTDVTPPGKEPPPPHY
ncbi:MAG: SlyX family protein [Rhodospirillaceae bacterium]|nr:SlyX family protein [Rhodospirillaceae bacterium]